MHLLGALNCSVTSLQRKRAEKQDKKVLILQGLVMNETRLKGGEAAPPVSAQEASHWVFLEKDSLYKELV